MTARMTIGRGIAAALTGRGRAASSSGLAGGGGDFGALRSSANFLTTPSQTT